MAKIETGTTDVVRVIYPVEHNPELTDTAWLGNSETEAVSCSTLEDIKTLYTGAIAENNTGFVSGHDVATALNTKVDKVENAGLITDAEREKLAGIAEGANAYVLPAATAATLGGVKIGTGLEMAEDGTLSATPSSGSGGGVGQAYPDSIGGEIFNVYEGVHKNNASGEHSHAEGRSAKAIGLASHAEGWNTYAPGSYSHAEGGQCHALGSYSHAEGDMTHASGSSSHAEGSRTKANDSYSHAEGNGSIASESSAHAEGSYTVASGRASHAGGYGTLANAYGQTAIGCYNTESPSQNPSIFIISQKAFLIGNGNSVERSDAFRVFFNGNVEAEGTYSSPAAAYAELFEWADGNPDNEDRVGRFVTPEGSKIRLATPADTYLLGVVSGAPSLIGDNPLAWQAKYQNDEWGRLIYEEMEVEYKELENDEEVVKTRTDRIRKLNPAYDPTQPYTPRLERPEWDAVGMIGKLLVLQDGTLQAGSFCISGPDGLATASQSGYYVLEVINDTQAKIIMK